MRQNPATRGYLLGALVYELGRAPASAGVPCMASSDALAEVAEGSGDTAFAIVGSGLLMAFVSPAGRAATWSRC